MGEVHVLNSSPCYPEFEQPQGKSLWKTLWDKEKMLVIFSFSYNVFYLFTTKIILLATFYLSPAKALNLHQAKHLSFHKRLGACSKQNLDLPILKANTNISSISLKMAFFCDRMKKRKYWLSEFSPLPMIFLRLPFQDH